MLLCESEVTDKDRSSAYHKVKKVCAKPCEVLLYFQNTYHAPAMYCKRCGNFRYNVAKGYVYMKWNIKVHGI